MLNSQATYDLERSFELDDADGVGEPLTAYLEATRGAFSRNTERALRADVQIFEAWCRQHFRAAFPASAATVVAFVDEMARVKTPATVRRYVSSIAALHKALRQTSPLESAAVRFALQRMHRLRGRRQAQVQGLTWPLRNRLLEAAGDRLIDVRNRALLAVGYDTLLRRSELVSLEVSDWRAACETPGAGGLAQSSILLINTHSPWIADWMPAPEDRRHAERWK